MSGGSQDQSERSASRLRKRKGGVVFQNAAGRAAPAHTEYWIRRVLQCEIRARGLPPDCEDGITVRLVDDATMRSFNSRYKQRRTTTDVLAFSTGDILISLDRASVQARDENHSVRREVLHLALHGWLHLNGFRDARPDEAARMEREIEEILNRFPKLRKAQSRRRALKRTGA